MSTKIRLHWQTDIDFQHQPQGQHVRIIRLIALVCFPEGNDWSHPYEVIVDTGSPLTLLPKMIWQNMNVHAFLSEAISLGGIGKGVVSARLAEINVAFLETRKEIVELKIKAYLAEHDAVPLLLGVEDLLTQARLVCDYPKGKAFLQV